MKKEKRAEYESPLCGRYAGAQMREIFSPDRKFGTWRRLWLALAEAEKELGLPITDAQIAELRAHLDDVNYEDAERRERETRHDVMAHIYAYGLQCPTAKPVIHLGATSCFVGDNTDIILMREALGRIRQLLTGALDALATFAEKYKDLPCLAYTHFQPAQPTTLGKRACLWIQDLMSDLERLDFTASNLKLLGCKGATGTAAGFMELFGGDAAKVLKLEKLIAAKMNFSGVYPVGGQTYSRKVDYFVLSVLSGICQSAAKFSNDIRLGAHMREIDEPFEEEQVGSSAMAYKRNPMRSERIASLARYVITDALNPALTASAQWFERTLDDSANKRISVPEAFLATDAVLSLQTNIIGNAAVNREVIKRRLKEELPFLATENIIMYCVKKGGDRQELHEAVRLHSSEALKSVKSGGGNGLLRRIAADPAFGITEAELQKINDPEKFTGMAAAQTEAFLKEVRTALKKTGGHSGAADEIRV